MQDERPIDVIRRMNPGVDIPTGAELAARLGGGSPEDGKRIKCPGCDLELLESDLRGQVKHMEEFHPDIIAERLKNI